MKAFIVLDRLVSARLGLGQVGPWRPASHTLAGAEALRRYDQARLGAELAVRRVLAVLA